MSSQVLQQLPTKKAREEAAFLFDDNIVAKPLAPSGIDNLKLKNPNLYVRWVNCSFQGGVMLEQAKAKGFVAATENDVEIPGIKPVNGVFRYMDTILMKIDRNAALGSMKANNIRALRQAERQTDKANNRRHLGEALGEVSAPAEQKKKIQAFDPSSKDLGRLESK